MTPLEQWPETVRLLKRLRPDKFWIAMTGALMLVTGEYPSGDDVVIHHDSVDDLIAASRAVGISTSASWYVHIGPIATRWIGMWLDANGATHDTSSDYPTEEEARLAAVNAGVRAMSEKTEAHHE